MGIVYADYGRRGFTLLGLTLEEIRAWMSQVEASGCQYLPARVYEITQSAMLTDDQKRVLLGRAFLPRGMYGVAIWAAGKGFDDTVFRYWPKSFDLWYDDDSSPFDIAQAAEKTGHTDLVEKILDHISRISIPSHRR